MKRVYKATEKRSLVKGNIRVTVDLTPELFTRLLARVEKLRGEENVTVTSLIRRSIIKGLKGK